MRRQIVVEIRLFRQESDLCLHFWIGPFLAENASCPRCGEDQPHEHFECGGLSSSVGAKESEDLSVFHHEMQWLQGTLRALAPEADHVDFFQTQDFNRGHNSGAFERLSKKL